MSKNDYHGGSLRTIAFKKMHKLKKFNTKKLINDEVKKNI